MLVLSRRLDESILIGDNIRVTVVRLTNSTVRLGIEAPGDVRVIREELDEKDSSEMVVTVKQADAL
jgi:carbon storage regulator CsrA|tara:strand:- start:871 stop:1068 length:198 start_codon:yes stop_codon:yes gene_type:complete